jgi:U3 small nucleolar RNA-associated protein 25
VAAAASAASAAAAAAASAGYTRCKVLVLLPCRNSAHRFIRELLRLYPAARAPRGRTDGEDRFEAEFGPGPAAERRADRERLTAAGGEEHWERFEGNVDDHFRVGVQLQGRYARLFAPFYAADVIVASPLGLRLIVKAEGDRGREHDFLSSVEMLVVDQVLARASSFTHARTHARIGVRRESAQAASVCAARVRRQPRLRPAAAR